MSVSGPFSGILFRLFQSPLLASMQLIFERMICSLTNNKNQSFHLMLSFHVHRGPDFTADWLNVVIKCSIMVLSTLITTLWELSQGGSMDVFKKKPDLDCFTFCLLPWNNSVIIKKKISLHILFCRDTFFPLQCKYALMSRGKWQADEEGLK